MLNDLSRVKSSIPDLSFIYDMHGDCISKYVIPSEKYTFHLSVINDNDN